MNPEQQNKSSSFRKVATITFLSLCIQSAAYGWLWSESQEHSGPLSGLILIPLVAIVAASLLIHLILFLVKKRDFVIPLIASVLFWSLALGVPYFVTIQKDKVELEKYKSWEDAIDSQFREHIEPLLKKRYGDSIIPIYGGYEIKATKDTLIVSYAYSTKLLVCLSQKMETAPLEADTAFWLKKIELVRPLLSDVDSRLLDSIKSAKAIRIYNSKTASPEYPLELSVEFLCGRRFLWEAYKEAYPGQQFTIEYSSTEIGELPHAGLGTGSDNEEIDR